MTLQDFFTVAKESPSGVLVGVAWALYVIVTHIAQNVRNSRQQSLVDRGSSSLVTSLQTMATNANTIAQQERDRADRLTRESMELNAEIGALRSDLTHCREARADATAKLTQAEEVIEQLVVENRNKDQSITQLVELNKHLLRTMGSSVDTLEPVSVLAKEIPQ